MVVDEVAAVNVVVVAAVDDVFVVVADLTF